MRQSWTDDRLDDFRAEVNCRFDRVDHRFELVDERFERVDERFEAVDRSFERIDADLRELRDAVYSMQRAMLQVGGGMLITLIVGFTGVLVAQL